MIDPSTPPDVVDVATASGFDWRNGYLGPGVDGAIVAYPDEAARPTGVGSLRPSGLLRCDSVLEPVRGEPAHRAEMISEVRGGEHLLGLLRRGDWWLIAGEDGYVGWIHRWVLAEEDESSRSTRSAGWIGRFRPPLGTLWVSDNRAHAPLFMGAPLLRVDAELVARGDWRLVADVHGHEGWIPASAVESDVDTSVRALLRRARSLLGTPYRWGGRSPLGFDCSGFVQFVFALGGRALPRDASQQQHAGEPVDLDPEAWRPGDLLLFGERADHVGIFEGQGRMIHCRAGVTSQALGEITPLMERLSAVRRVPVRTEDTTATLWVRTTGPDRSA